MRVLFRDFVSGRTMVENLAHFGRPAAENTEENVKTVK